MLFLQAVLILAFVASAWSNRFDNDYNDQDIWPAPSVEAPTFTSSRPLKTINYPTQKGAFRGHFDLNNIPDVYPLNNPSTVAKASPTWAEVEVLKLLTSRPMVPTKPATLYPRELSQKPGRTRPIDIPPPPLPDNRSFWRGYPPVPTEGMGSTFQDKKDTSFFSKLPPWDFPRADMGNGPNAKVPFPYPGLPEGDPTLEEPIPWGGAERRFVDSS